MNPVAEYIAYHRNNALLWEIDTHLYAAVWFADNYNLDTEQRYWLAFLTAICETTPTSIYLFRHFPSVRTTNPKEFAAFCSTRRQAMAFQYDVRWILYDIEAVVSSYKDLLRGRTQHEVLSSMAVGDTPEERFVNFLKKCIIKKFGKYVMMLYTELLHYLCGINFEAVVDPADNHSVRSGLIYACGLEDCFLCVKKGSSPTTEERGFLMKEMDAIRKHIATLDINPRHKRMWAIETTLCTYNKTKHGKRYLGFYRARQAKEINRLISYTRSINENFNWSELVAYHNNWGKWGNNYIV